MIKFVKITENEISCGKGLPPGFWRDDENLIVHAPKEYICLYAGDSGGALPGNDELDPIDGSSWESILSEVYMKDMKEQEALKFLNTHSPLPFREVVDILVDLSDNNYVYYERWIFGIPSLSRRNKNKPTRRNSKFFLQS